MSSPPSARRFAIWAAFLVAPLALGAVVYPWLARRLGPLAASPGAAGTAGTAAATGPDAPRQPEAPTTAQIEAARQADVDLARAQQGWQRVETMAPREARRDEHGELVAPFQGFGLSVESTPPGATVRVKGRDAGETPLVTTVDCRPGDELELRVELRGRRPAVRQVRCRADTLMTVQVALAR